MKKEIISFLTAIALMLTLAVPAFAATYGEPSITLSGTPSYASADATTIDYEAMFGCNYAAPSAAKITKVTLENSGELQLVSGKNVILNPSTAIKYYFTFSVPSTLKSQTQLIEFVVEYEYKASDAAGTLPTNGSTKVFSKIEIEKKTVIANEKVTIENVVADSSGVVGGEINFSGEIMNSGDTDVKDVNVRVVDSEGTAFGKNYVSVLKSGTSQKLAYKFNLPKVSGNKKYRCLVTYIGSSGNSSTLTEAFYVDVKDSIPVSVANLTFKDSVKIDEENNITFDVINSSDEAFKSVTAYIADGNNIIKTSFIGTLDKQSKSVVEIKLPLSAKGTYNYNIVVYYTNTADQKLSVKKPLKIVVGSVTVANSKPLTIANLKFPQKLDIGQDGEISMNIINAGDTDYTNGVIYLMNGNNVVSTNYIGKVALQTSTESKFAVKFNESGTNKYTIKLEYNDADGKTTKLTKGVTIAVNKINEEQFIKIQSVNPPVLSNINELITVPFNITNPSAVSVKSADAYLYDQMGNELSSIFIATIEPNSTQSLNLTVNSPATGDFIYKLEVRYKDKDDKEATISKSFSMSFKDPAVTTSPTEKEKADIRVQKIQNPNMMYTDVNTEVKLTLVNAGKGLARNVEIYVTDVDGNEVAREYIGNIATASKEEAAFKVKFKEIGDFPLTVHVSFQNEDETIGTSEKSFEQKVMKYRASLQSIAGIEYAMVGQEANLEFSLLNSGTAKLLNTNVVLADKDGKEYGKVYIGTVEPGAQKERQKIKKIMFDTEGKIDLTLTVTYENEDFDVFSFSENVTASVNPAFDGGGMMPMPETEVSTDDKGVPIVYETDAQGNIVYDKDGMPKVAQKDMTMTIVAVLVGVGLAIIITVVVIVVVRKKKKAKSEGDDLEYFYAKKDDKAKTEIKK